LLVKDCSFPWSILRNDSRTLLGCNPPEIPKAADAYTRKHAAILPGQLDVVLAANADEPDSPTIVPVGIGPLARKDVFAFIQITWAWSHNQTLNGGLATASRARLALPIWSILLSHRLYPSGRKPVS
jgi:hypothetical protein